MIKLSKWASKHPVAARSIIIISSVLMLLGGIAIATLLFLFDWGAETETLVLGAAACFFVLFATYPVSGGNKEQYKASYKRRKLYDFGLLSFAAVVVIFGVHNFLVEESYQYEQPLSARVSATQPPAQFIALVPASKAEQPPLVKKKKKASLKRKARTARKQFRKKLRKTKRENRNQEESTGIIVLKIFLLLLIIAAVIGLGYLVLALACSLACSGMGALAVVVMILGWGGLISGAIVGIVALFRDRERWQVKKEEKRRRRRTRQEG